MSQHLGQQFGSYRLLRLLGKGGFAEVYLGEHVRLKSQAAIKVLHSTVEDDDADNFFREAQTVARLKHRHIVRVFDFDVEHHTPFLVMDYLPRGNVRRSYPKDSPLPLEILVHYVRQIASALQYAHDQKLIHRDIKPENMLLDEDNTIVLTDFGIALIAQSSRYQSTQEVAGTAAYMAPEQFQGHPHRASDQYALGVVAYEWLTGTRPFHGTFTEIASQHLFVPPPALREKAPNISPEVEQVILTALEKDPQKRFGSVQAFANALGQASQVEVPTLWKAPSQALAPQSGPIAPPTALQQQAVEVASSPIVDSAAPETEARIVGERSPDVKLPETAPLKEPSPSSLQPAARVKVWRIGKVQFATLVLGAILFGELRTLINPSFPVQLTTWSFVLFPLLVTLLFFGNVAGPWVGLLTGCGGYLISSLLLSEPIYWSTGLSYGLVGFIAGLVLLKTQRRYNTIRSIALVEIVGAVGIIIGRAFSYGAGLLLHNITLAATLSLFPRQELPSIVPTLIALPLLLLAYGAINKRTYDEQVWGIGKRQVVAMIAGNILYCLSFLALLGLSRLGVDVRLAGYSNILILLPLVTILFFGAAFGPWVGLLTVIGSSLIGGIFFGAPPLAFALSGFIAGLALLRTKGDYHTFSALVIAAGAGFIGSLVGVALASGISIFGPLLLSAIAGLIVLPILLVIRNVVVNYVTVQPLLSSQSTGTDTPASQLSEPVLSAQRRLSVPRTVLLAGLALTLIAGSAGLFSLLRANQIAVERANAIATTLAVMHANATATTIAAAATATMIAQNPDPYPPGGTLALYDPLSKTNIAYGWDEGTNSVGDGCKLTGGAYHVKEITPNYLHQCIAESTDFKNFAFEVQMTIIKGGSGGIIFRADGSSGKWYDLDISQNGQYFVARYDGFKPGGKIITSGTASSFKAGLNQSNSIAVVANGSTFNLYVNGQEVITFSDSTYSHGQIGVLASDSPTEVEYNNAKVWTL
jgi:serine/threonine protein kinase